MIAVVKFLMSALVRSVAKGWQLGFFARSSFIYDFLSGEANRGPIEVQLGAIPANDLSRRLIRR